ncbi:MAG TPA: SDR family NAD(P)-dependent oxidoreductase [Ktedonobacterales bacterium]|jgi:3-oxoacyl-[acyl-carrier protein] reductase|nr:SDR family NAD(P)-dependent oxidoreductase [Ktedonobacterales bacterium]
MGRLDGRVALVTGAGRGIGAATAQRLAEEGARVTLADVDRDGTSQLVKQLAAQDAEALAVTCDVTDAASVQAAVDETLNRFGRLDILVNNAGVVRDNLVFKMTDDEFEAVLAVHLRGAFHCTRAAQKPMVEQQYGRIISLSSTSALGNRGQTNYAAVKAAIQGMTRTWAIELGPFGITANAVAPGFIDTAMTQATARRMGIEPEVFKAAAAQRIPLRRVGQPSEVASVIAFLASDDASFVSGQTIYIAGGPVGLTM